MKKTRVICGLLLIFLIVIGVYVSMGFNELGGYKIRSESDEQYSRMMLEYIEKKYDKDFEIVKCIFPQEGFNTSNMQNYLLVKESQLGITTRVYSTLGSPYTYYDDYVSDFASWTNRNIVDTSSLDRVASTKLYLYLRDENINALDISKDNVSHAVLAVNINSVPDADALEKLYKVYCELIALDYDNVFLIAGFTESNEAFDDYVNFYRVFGKKRWEDYGGVVYATLTAKNGGLSFDDFQKLCESK